MVENDASRLKAKYSKEIFTEGDYRGYPTLIDILILRCSISYFATRNIVDPINGTEYLGSIIACHWLSIFLGITAAPFDGGGGRHLNYNLLRETFRLPAKHLLARQQAVRDTRVQKQCRI